MTFRNCKILAIAFENSKKICASRNLFSKIKIFHYKFFSKSCPPLSPNPRTASAARGRLAFWAFPRGFCMPSSIVIDVVVFCFAFIQ